MRFVKFILIACLVMILGCAQRAEYNPCCLDYAGDITCYYGEQEFNPLDYDAFCNATGCYDTMNFEITKENRDINISYMPYCSTATYSECDKQGCYAMICGDTSYDPKEDPSYCYVFTAYNQSHNDEVAGLYQTSDTSQLLYNTKCEFYEMTDKTKEKVSEGAWINAFRGGVGNSYSDFEEARYYIPITDFAIRNTEGKTDRFVNYLPLRDINSLDTHTWTDLTSYIEPYMGFSKDVTGSNLCSYSFENNNNIYTCTHNGAQYNFTSYNYGSNISAKQSCNQICSAMKNDWYTETDLPFLNSSGQYFFNDYVLKGVNMGGAITTAEVKQINHGFYDIALTYAYWPYTGFATDENLIQSLSKYGDTTALNGPDTVDTDSNEFTDMESGWHDNEGAWHIGMPFECTNEQQCAGGVCSKLEHRRFSCTDKDTRKEIDCGIELDDQSRLTFETIVSNTSWDSKQGEDKDLGPYDIRVLANIEDKHPTRWLYFGDGIIAENCKISDIFDHYTNIRTASLVENVVIEGIEFGRCGWSFWAPEKTSYGVIFAKPEDLGTSSGAEDYLEDEIEDFDANYLFWTQENANDLKFVQACEMQEGQDYKIIDLGDYFSGSSYGSLTTNNGAQTDQNALYLRINLCFRLQDEDEKINCLEETNAIPKYGSTPVKVLENVKYEISTSYVPGSINDLKPSMTYDEGWHRVEAMFADKVMLIKSFGKCEMQNDNLIVNDFGWCKPGTTLSFAVQEIESVVNTYQIRQFRTDIPGYNVDDREELGIGWCAYNDQGYEFDNCRYGAGGKGLVYARTGFGYLPDAKYLYDKTIEYQKNGIMPIWFADDKDLWYGENDKELCGLKKGNIRFYSKGNDATNCNELSSETVSAKQMRSGSNVIGGLYNEVPYIIPNNVLGMTVGTKADFYKIYKPAENIETYLSIFEESENGKHGADTLNTGSMIIVVDQLVSGQDDPERIKERARTIKQACPKCLIGVLMNWDGSQLLFENNGIKDQEALGLIDLIVFHEPQPKIKVGVEREIIYKYNSTQKLNISKNLILNYNKPSLWFTNHDTGSLMQDQRIATENGIIGEIAQVWKSNSTTEDIKKYPLIDSHDQKTEQFYSFQNGTFNLLQFNIQTSYRKVYATNISNCSCIQCTNLEVSLGQCNPYCSDGQLCTGYSGSNQKCTNLCARIDCIQCSDLIESYTCINVYSNGTVEQGPTGQLSDLNYLFPDVLGSLPNDKKCCVIDPTSLNPVTYIKQSRVDRNSELVIWNENADDTTECGKAPLQGEYAWCNEIPSTPIQEGELICY